jgi:hypothetical protein
LVLLLDSDTMMTGATITAAIHSDGFVFAAGHETASALALDVSSPAWQRFKESWNRLHVDTYMADGGRYRKRRHSVFTARDSALEPAAHQAHFQGLDFNPLNGGVQRWFEPLEPKIVASDVLQTIMQFSAAQFEALAPATARWKVEVHQFRIEASSAEAGKPTPEGMHRDGVDYVLVMLIDRVNIASGTTQLADADKRQIGEFTLTNPLDSVLLDDHRVYHGVTAISPLDPRKPAWRDVLVVTFLAAG